MKRILILLLFCFSLMMVTSCDDEPVILDEIELYKIVVHPREDATLDMVYMIQWHVLNSTQEGPLNEVRIGVANQYVSDLHAISDSIKNLYYSSDSGAQIVLELDRDYEAGSLINLVFSFQQSRIFKIEHGEVTYAFQPGWFNQIQVKQLIVEWDKEGVIYQNSNQLSNHYYVWSTSLDFGETTNIELKYPLNYFPAIRPDEDYSSSVGGNEWIIFLVISIVCIVIFLIVIALRYIKDDGYEENRGFTGRRNFHIYHHYGIHTYYGFDKSGKSTVPKRVISSDKHTGSSGCACACACACAGGGRAGCARKEFYYTSSTSMYTVFDQVSSNQK